MSFDSEALAARGLLTPEAMGRADRRTIEAGTPRNVLVARAARAVFRVLRARFLRQPVVVLAGPGQNGADGVALAELLREAGWPLTLIDLTQESGEARELPEEVRSCLRPADAFSPGKGQLVIDALFGAGLSRPVEGAAEALLGKAEGSGADILAIDLPSGVDGATGEVLGTAIRADVTVTFHRLKPGHLLGAGAELCGRVYLCDIGIEGRKEDISALHNHPSLWRHLLGPGPHETHKYERGHCAVIGGPGVKGGAARLAARTASVSGAGAVTYFSPLSSIEFAASSFDAVMVRAMSDPDVLEEALQDKITSVVIGPGMGRSDLMADCLIVALESGLPVLLDADALTLHEDDPDHLFELLHGACVLTPHEGEFARLFGDLEGDKLSRTREAAARAGATVLLKGSTTAIAGEGLPILSTSGGPSLATAGSGDCLSGLIGGLLARGLPPVAAAAAGAWLHGEAGRDAGPSLNADALPERIARSLTDVLRTGLLDKRRTPL